MANQEIVRINVEDLHLWTENPRDRVDATLSDFDVIKRAMEDSYSKWDLKKFANKMGEYYDFSELPTVVKEKGRYIVYDGNRRIAVLKCLQDPEKYSQFIEKLYPKYKPEQLKIQTIIPCNVCDKETALTNIERKHIDDSSWGAIERDYFSYNFREKEKSPFLIIDEQTGFITNNSVLNKRFVKEEVLTKKNLEDIGFVIKNGALRSNYSKENVVDIFLSIYKLLADKIISTRDSRTELKRPLLEKFPNLRSVIGKKKGGYLNVDIINDQRILEVVKKKTKMTKSNDYLFGKILSLETGVVNDLYNSIDFIDKKVKSLKSNEYSLLVIGMSLRLLLDTAGREYYKSMGDIEKSEQDQLYKDFIKLAASELSKQKLNYLAITNDWLSKEFSLESLLSKYAHGNITPTRSDVLRMSVVVGDILEFYFKSKTKET